MFAASYQCMVALGSLFVTSSAAVFVVPSQVVRAVVTPIGVCTLQVTHTSNVTSSWVAGL